MEISPLPKSSNTKNASNFSTVKNRRKQTMNNLSFIEEEDIKKDFLDVEEESENE